VRGEVPGDDVPGEAGPWAGQALAAAVPAEAGRRGEPRAGECGEVGVGAERAASQANRGTTKSADGRPEPRPGRKRTEAGGEVRRDGG